MQMAIIALLGLASLFTGWILLIVLPEIRAFAFGILVLGAVLLAAAFIYDFRRVRGALMSRRGRHGVSTTVKVALFIGIILFVNALSAGTYHRFDFTGLAQFTLTSQTKEVLARLNKPVQVVLFFTPGSPIAVSGYARNLLSEYQNYSNQLKVMEIDPDVHPDQARQYGIDRSGVEYGAVVFKSAEGQRLVLGPQIVAEAEHAFTSAILEVTGSRQKKVYFLTGHGENSIRSDYGSARNGLRDNLFQVDELDLSSAAGIPGDAAVLVIAGPQKPLTGGELEVIRMYLRAGGRALILLNPGAVKDFQPLIAEWGMDLPDGTLLDPASHVAPSRDYLLVPGDRNSLKLAETYFPGATALIPAREKSDDVELIALVWTSPEARLGAESRQPVDGPAKGPFAIGALISTIPEEGSEALQGTRLVVIGDSDFATNRNFHNGANGDLFLTAVHWLTAGKDIISVDRKVLDARRLLLSPEEARFLHISSIGLLPLLLLAAGAYVWWRRRV